MKRWRRLLALFVVAAITLTGCSGTYKEDKQSEGNEEKNEEENKGENMEENQTNIETGLSEIDNTKWKYNEEDGVYWQIGISYCENPADEQYETLGIFVPAAYMKAEDNGDGTYTCQIDQDGKVEGYTAADAPIVIPVDTPGYTAMAAPTDYVKDAAEYTAAGFVYVNAGCRGRDAGAPAGITDLKAAVRYIRYCSQKLPGSAERIFTFGMSGGGAQSALMGATGDSELYTPYLNTIGAVTGVSDAVAGSMCWCPITSLDYADEAYEWNMGSSRLDLDEETKELSDNMATAFGEYINKLGLVDEEGNILTLEQSESGIYQAGSYYEYIKDVIEQSLNNFLSDTEFPYTSGGIGKNPGGRGGIGNGEDIPDEAKEQLKEGGGRGDRDKKEIGDGETIPDAMKEQFENGAQGGYADAHGEFQEDGVNRINGEHQDESKTYQTPQEYIDDLNADGVWITYDSTSNTAAITGMEDFVKKCKTASKNVGAFDDLNTAQAENILFGYGDGEGAHFDLIMAELLKNTDYAEAYEKDLQKTDGEGNTVDVRVNMYNPMYYLSDYYDGYQTANVAKYWRIRTGIAQGDTSLTTEVNLALALNSYGNTSVDFETVWGQGHVMAERTGNSTDNFISWVNECLKDEK